MRTIPQLLATIREGANNIPQLGAQATTVSAIDSLAVEINDLVAALRIIARDVGQLPAAGHPHLLGSLINAKHLLRQLDGAEPSYPEPPLPDAQLANGGACS